ncbi:SgcJ/EcaC family oxidoreductase [Streptomyces rapamycinicus]|uniref:SnoaL-like domain-containing protein n=2 Tax=Streptomyces rapamycinicus TaxID=1226757 RepID=A0A0A0NMI6_STRRN|nr:SgcJ/EcaC family oxidoreductase [Streptomyces rapamycinicus]AGP55595.1 hypothetical protein M271_20245 [Streptomyces rapamycinicus NRRL 5491]MBB4783156.1 uncharacterized protein (TIGR02246 family) [Streptomyces rapamycinicus]RLV81369.1 hypothetical protein D3C57_123330 [Streptomyces rapamycinicus NRRL 5491]UTO63579.1 SgcJ/EcaC family oxidoreductase [Streptomyces rapamycinicus]UTP31535.1 SgcJ/EcaC family oxidoreductase [Streptomyces rapamycinicus NRRL 5491]
MADRPWAQSTPAREEDVHQIQELFTELETAASAHDAVGFNARFTADVTFTVGDGRRFRGWEEIHSYHKERLDHHAEGFRTSLEIDHITFPAADVAVVSTRQHWATPQDSGANAGTWVLTRKDGAWWVCTVQNTRITTA